MTVRSDTIRAVREALVLLKGLGAQSPSSKLGPVGDRVKSMFAVLDSMIGNLPDPTPEDLLTEVERVVEVLHYVDQNWPACGDADANQRLELAGARLRRIGASLL